MNDALNHCSRISAQARRNLTIVLLLAMSALLTGAVPLEARVSKSAAEKPIITEGQFLNLFKEGVRITDRTVPATAILNALNWAIAQKRGGKLNDFASLVLSNCIVKGNLQLSGKAVPLSFALHDVTFEGSAEFRNTIFGDVINISGVTFMGVVVFEGATFESSVEFSSNTYESFVSLRDATFKFETTFYDQTFKHPVDFTGAVFEKMVSFGRLTFKDDADFSRTVFKAPVRFERATFEGLASFRDFDISQSATFRVTYFGKDAFFDQLRGRSSASLEFFGVTFGGRAYFDDSRVANLRFSTRFSDRDISEMDTPEDARSKAMPEFTRRFYSPTVFEKLAVFRGLESERVDFTEAEFQDQADFIGARFSTLARFRDATFKGEVNFFGAEFPKGEATTIPTKSQPDQGLVLDGTHFRDRVLLNWGQLVQHTPWWQLRQNSPLKVVTANPSTWYALEEVFRRSGNLHAQNEALYQRRLLSRSLGDSIDEGQLSNYFAWLLWGYGVRPLRLVCWMAAVFVLFTWIYWTQTPSKSPSRLKAAFHFSIRNSWKLNYGYERALTPPFKVATLVHSWSMKVMGLFLLQVLANVSPLLNAVLGKLLPI